MVTIKCSPHHFGDRVLLMGDAAHAMVAFYGQGINCGFEDVLVMDKLFNKWGNNQIRKKIVLKIFKYF